MIEPLTVYARGDNHMILHGVQRMVRRAVRRPSIPLATAGEFEMFHSGSERNARVN